MSMKTTQASDHFDIIVVGAAPPEVPLLWSPLVLVSRCCSSNGVSTQAPRTSRVLLFMAARSCTS